LSDPGRAAREPFKNARDSNGHGTHTGSTAAGDVIPSAPIFGVERGPANGIAPGAWVSVYKVCGISGCFTTDSMRAVQKAILDGVDVINFSISGGTSPFTDAVELAFLDAYAAGVVVATSAGNDGPTAGTANHLSPWTTSVAASTQSRAFESTLTVTAPGGASKQFVGASITAGAGPAPIVLSSAAPYNRPLCDAPAPAGLFAGKIVACQRGVNARVEKGFNVLQGGALGMVLYNPTLADVNTDNHWLPTVHLANGTDFLAFVNANPGSTAQFTAGVAAEGQGDVVAAFSSRGPAGNFIKPDIAAPGVQILAGHTPVPGLEGILGGPNGQFFQAIAGTSMASPHIAGSAILLRALHPDWTPGQVKSALMTTAVTDLVKQDLTTPADPFDIGAGRVDLTVAGNPGVTLDESADRMFALANDPLNAVHLNLPSVNAPTMPGALTTTRTVTNVSGRTQHYAVETTAPDDSSITVEPAQFAVQPGTSATLTITIQSNGSSTQHFGEIRLLPRGGDVPSLHMPVAFVPKQGDVSLTSACDPARIARQQTSTCTITAQNNALEDTVVDMTTSVNKYLRIDSASAPATLSGGQAVVQDQTLARRRLGVPSVDPGTSLGYVGLTGTPTPIADEQILNFNLPVPFVYNSVTYTQIGVDSNGYVLAGPGSGLDNNCCSLPSGPNPARPNNMLAPFWTDLNGAGAQGIRVAIATLGANRWIVVDWNVVVFGTTDVRRFQVWIGVSNDATPDQDITFAYSAAQADPHGQLFLVGAENPRGEGDMEAVLPSGDLAVTSTAPQAGGSLSYNVVVSGHQAGPGVVTTELVSDRVAGTTVAKSTVDVTK
jgi:hypothetical protein